MYVCTVFSIFYGNAFRFVVVVGVGKAIILYKILVLYYEGQLASHTRYINIFDPIKCTTEGGRTLWTL